MRAEIEISLDSLLSKVSRESMRTASSQRAGGARAITRSYITHRELPWFIDASREADAKIRASLSPFLVTSIDDVSDQKLIYNIACRDQCHADTMADLLERTLVELICNSWYRTTFQPQAKYDMEILGELKSHAYLTKRAERKYSLY